MLVLFHVAVTVSPILKTPPVVPLAPLIEMFAFVTTSDTLSTVAFAESETVVAFPALSVTVTDTFRFVPSIDPETIV
jgi:hypothetical protein